MKIEDLTIKQVRELQRLFSNSIPEQSNAFILESYIGKYVIVRTRNEGINAGVVSKISKEGVVITDARRIYYHKPKDRKVAWYEGVAMTGLSSDSKISGTVDEKVIVEDYSLTLCSKEAEDSIRNHKAQES